MSDVSQEVLELFRNGAATERIANMLAGPGRRMLSASSQRQGTGIVQLRVRYASYRPAAIRFQPAAGAAQKLAVNAPTEAEGLYWETRSAQKLATNALARASQSIPIRPSCTSCLGTSTANGSISRMQSRNTERRWL